jgi:hypothetical protein
VAAWVEFDSDGKATRVEGAELVAHFRRQRSGPPARLFEPSSESSAPSTQANRFFGPGDVLRNATLEFGSDSLVEVQSRFENCSLRLAEGSRLTIGEDGVLDGCEISGPGRIVIGGKFVQGDGLPSIVGPRALTVLENGALAGTVQQHPDLTDFGFARGCYLRMNIIRDRGTEGNVDVRY